MYIKKIKWKKTCIYCGCKFISSLQGQSKCKKCKGLKLSYKSKIEQQIERHLKRLEGY